VDALGQIAQRNKISTNVADLVLVRLADIEHENVFTGIEPPLQLFYLNFGNSRLHRFLLTTDSAKFIVVDQFGHGWMGSASRAIRILAQLELAELHSQSINQQQAADQWLTLAKNQFDDLGSLNHSNQTRQNPEYSPFRALRHE